MTIHFHGADLVYADPVDTYRKIILLLACDLTGKASITQVDVNQNEAAAIADRAGALVSENRELRAQIEAKREAR